MRVRGWKNGKQGGRQSVQSYDDVVRQMTVVIRANSRDISELS